MPVGRFLGFAVVARLMLLVGLAFFFIGSGLGLISGAALLSHSRNTLSSAHLIVE